MSDHDQADSSTSPGPERPRGPGRRLLSALFALLFIAFLAGGLFFGYIFATTAIDLLAASTPPPIDVPAPTAAVEPSPPVESGTPVAAAPASTAPASPPAAETPTVSPTAPIPVPEYLGKDRITVLLLGLDLRGVDRNTPTRSDTMILVTVDPVTKRTGMISIPRDLWVAIPGHGQNKINTAHYFGERDKTGGGPELARQTVELNFGVHVQYWARVDFHGFERLIDAVGGVTVDANRAIKDDVYPTENNGVLRMYIPTGLQHLNGAEALRFARSRHSDNDFGRSSRQRQVLVAARQRLLQPSVILKIPELIGIARGSVDTNIPLTEYLPLANLARQVNTSDIVSRAIEYSMTIDVNGDGTVLLPKRDDIRSVLDEVFGVKPAATTAPSPVAPTSTPVASPTVAPAAPTPPIKVQILNGTNQTGFAEGWADRLRAAGYVVTLVKQADQLFQETLVQDHTGRAGAASALCEAIGVLDAIVEAAPPVADGSDLTVILGNDVGPP